MNGRPTFAKRQSAAGFATAVTLVAFALPVTALALPTETPEKETLRISRALKSIPDDRWREIAGSEITGKYEVMRGDTLSSISKRLFGDSRYWPKIWSMNNRDILNPHQIRPGSMIAFVPGSGTTLPGVQVQATPIDDVAEHTVTHPARSQDWRSLPPQEWEVSQIFKPQPSPTPVKIMGDLRRTSATVPESELPAFAMSSPAKVLGEISSSPYENEFLRPSDQVIVKGKGVEAGEVYTIVSPPTKLEKDKHKKQGYAYRVLGEIQIFGPEGKKDLWSAAILSAIGTIERGSLLVPRQPKLALLLPVPSAMSLKGMFYLDRADSTFLVGQDQVGFVNRGTDDGVQVGMVFESYQTVDPYSSMKIDDQRYHISDAQVIQVSDRFCTVLVIAGNTEIYESTPVHILTDVSDLSRRFTNENESSDAATSGLNEKTGINPYGPQSGTANELDKMDSEDQMTEDEKREIEQLERYKGPTSDSSSAPEPAPETAPAPVPPTDQTLPAPPSASTQPATPPPPAQDDSGVENVPPAPTAPSDTTPPPTADSEATTPDSANNNVPPPAAPPADTSDAQAAPPPPSANSAIDPGDVPPAPPPASATSAQDSDLPPPPPTAAKDSDLPPPPQASSKDAAPSADQALPPSSAPDAGEPQDID